MCSSDLDEVEGNLKLARRVDDDGEIKVLIETRGEGGYTIIAPSSGPVHETGKPWEIVRGDLSTIATITPKERRELLNIARSLDEMPSEADEAKDSYDWNQATSTSTGERPGDLYNERATGADVVALLEHHGWQTIHQFADRTQLRRPGKNLGVSATVFDTGWFVCFTSSTRFDQYVQGTKRGVYSPFGVYTILEHGGDYSAAARALAPETTVIIPGDSDAGEVGALADGHRPTDVGNAERLIEAGAGQIRYVHAWGRWLVYRGGRWQLDPNNALIRQVAKKVARQLFKLAANTQDKAQRDAAWSWAKRSETAGAITAMVDLARGDSRVLTDHNLLDADPWLLNCRNGTVDLRTGQLREHDPADLITMTTGVDYNPDAVSELWERCLQEWQHDSNVRNYLQRVAGAGATGHPTQTLQIDHGEGANGKTVFYGAISHSLGDYAGGIHKSLLVSGRHEQHDTVRADLFRRRLAIASETTDGHRLDEEKVKLLTGGDRIKARRMREDLWEYNPTHTIILHSNYKPTVTGTNHAIWRRLRLVPWTQTITHPDEGLADKLKAEVEAILAWTVRGAIEFIANGYDTAPPDTVRNATAEYRRSQDTIARFIDETLEFGTDWFTFSAALKEELEEWSKDQGLEQPGRLNELTAALTEHGCESASKTFEKGKRRRGWRGVRIRENPTNIREKEEEVQLGTAVPYSATETPSRRGEPEVPYPAVPPLHSCPDCGMAGGRHSAVCPQLPDPM